MVSYCDECGGKIALCTAGIYDVEPDQEPFESGEYVKLDDFNLRSGFGVTVNACIKCGKAHDAQINECFDPHKTMLDKPLSDKEDNTQQHKNTQGENDGD